MAKREGGMRRMPVKGGGGPPRRRQPPSGAPAIRMGSPLRPELSERPAARLERFVPRRIERRKPRPRLMRRRLLE